MIDTAPHYIAKAYLRIKYCLYPKWSRKHKVRMILVHWVTAMMLDEEPTPALCLAIEKPIDKEVVIPNTEPPDWILPDKLD